MKWIDLPPVWLLACLAVAYALPFGLVKLPLIGSAFVIAGVVLMVLALAEMRRYRTTPIPHMEADALVTSGIFAFSRNPIYLGDLLVLLGLSFRSGSLIGIALVPILFWVLKTRFILPEEARLEARFGEKFAYYCTQTRRWL